MVVTSAPSFLFEGPVAPPLVVREVECDIGLVQRDALQIDEAATAVRWRAFAAGWDDLVRAEAEWLRTAGARLVVGDIPPLAFAAAARYLGRDMERVDITVELRLDFRLIDQAQADALVQL